MDLAGVDFEVGGLVAGVADVVGGVRPGCPGIAGNGTGVTLCAAAGTGAGIGVLDEDLTPVPDAVAADTGIGVSPDVMMSVSSTDAASFAGLGRLQCTQQQSL